MRLRGYSVWPAVLPAMLLGVTGCGRGQSVGPPSVSYGNTVCDQCNMIISDERFAAASFVSGPRGRTPLVFDDYNCQLDFERGKPDLAYLDRWAHDHATRDWIPAETALFVRSERIRSPMASRVAAFASRSGADALIAELGEGDVIAFADLADAMESQLGTGTDP